MSIPKEPRQLMINLMYLVLTAMLALNVSAEIINAFFVVDKGIKKSNDIVGTANEAMINAIAKQVKAYPQYKDGRHDRASTQYNPQLRPDLPFGKWNRAGLRHL